MYVNQGGVYFSFMSYCLELGWGENMMINLEKNANIWGKRWKYGKKGEFSLYLGEKHKFS